MQKRYKSISLNFAAIVLTIPAAFIFLISVLKYGLDINGPYDASEPILQNWGIDEPLGLNINLLILFGPVAAFFISLLQVFEFKSRLNTEKLHIQLAFRKKWFPIAVAAFSLFLLGALFLYLLGENCICNNSIPENFEI